jgi:DNA polymerase-3 subunit alpha
MHLHELYELMNVPEKERLNSPKNIVLTVPAKEYDVKPWLEALGLTKWEVNVTFPKNDISFNDEILAIRPKLVIQLGQQFSRKFPFLSDGASPDAALLVRVQQAVADKFVVLHHHDEFSLQDALGTTKMLGDLLKSQNRSFMAVTNHGSIGGWIKQFNECKASGVKCIFGMEAYVEQYRGEDTEERKKHRSANHLLLLARTKEGFDNLVKIHNDAQMHGFYYSPRVDWEAIKKWGKGIVAMSACAAGEIPQALMAGNEAKAEEICRLYMASFDQFYIELQIIEMEGQREINRKLIEFAKRMGVQTVLSCDSHYLDSQHSETHSLLMYIRQKKTIKEVKEMDADVWDFDVKNLYYRNAEQMEDVFRNGFTTKDGKKCEPFLDEVFTEEVFYQSMKQTRAIAVQIDDISLDSKVKLPKMSQDSAKILREKVNAGYNRLGLKEKPNRKEYAERVRFEFETITKMGWADYFLIMDTIISFSKQKFGEFSVGYGRGSAAGCLVSYCLGLTDCDPLVYGLLFERFLDASRPDPPDIDTDFDPRYRDEIKEFIVSTFGEDNTCSIGTYGTYKTRAVILDIARALGYDVREAMELTKSLEMKVSVENEEGEEEDSSIDKVEWDELIEQFEDLRTYFAKYPEILFHARILRNQIKHVSTHAAGMIISDLNLKDRIPVFLDKNDKVVSCWNESGSSTELSSVGLVKFDILGLNNLCVVSDCIKLIEKTRGKKLERWEIPIDNKEAIFMGSKRDLVGIFQFENPSVKSVVEAVGMDCLEDVAAITSLIRPGPRDMGMDMEYARRKRGEPYDEVQCLRTLLSDTYGVMTYQEQVMRIARELAGFTMAEANKLRKGMGKKKKEVIAELRSKFMKGSQKAIDGGTATLQEVETVWLKIASFAKYGFNKSHAITYSALTCAELWLKFHYHIEYITALINNTSQGKKKFGEELFPSYINYARKCNFKVLSPDINRSQEQFTIEPLANGEGNAIRFSIGHVKNVANSAPVIIKNQPYTDMEDFYNRAAEETINKKTGKVGKRRVNKKVVESLLYAGAFDCFGTREAVMRRYYELRKEKDFEVPKDDAEWKAMESEMVGLILSAEPLKFKYEKLIKQNRWSPISETKERGQRIKVFGRIASARETTSKKGNRMMVVSLTDDLDSMTFFVFGGAMMAFKELFREGWVVAVPLNRFEDGDTRFYDVDRDGEIVEKTGI